MKKPSAGQESLLSQMQQELSSTNARGENRAVFLAMRDEIAETIAAGYTLKAIWEFLRRKERLTMCYATFRAHCKAEGVRRATKAAHGPRQNRSLVATSGHAACATVGQVTGPRRFSHPSEPDEKAIYGERD